MEQDESNTTMPPSSFILHLRTGEQITGSMEPDMLRQLIDDVGRRRRSSEGYPYWRGAKPQRAAVLFVLPEDVLYIA